MNPSAAQLTRRTFLGRASCAAVGTTGLVSALSQLRLIGAIAADSSAPRTAAGVPPDYKALVCLFLNGGNDGNNLIVPYDSASHAGYATARGTLALDRAQLLPFQL